jgi:hypothetical protein
MSRLSLSVRARGASSRAALGSRSAALAGAAVVSLVVQVAAPATAQPAPGVDPAQAPQPVAPNPYPYGPPMESNGVRAPDPAAGKAAPPPAVDPTGDSASRGTSYDAELDASKDRDSGRGLTWFWLEASGGFEAVGLRTFNVDETSLTAGFVSTSDSGGVVGAGIGARFYIFTIGARGRLGFFEAWQLGRVGGELGLRFPLGVLEPHLEVGGGYAALGNFDGVVAEKIAIEGGYARASAGLDVYPVGQFSIGAVASFDFLALTRPGVSLADLAALQSSNAITDAQSKILEASGSGYGSTFSIQGMIGLHL